MLKTVWTQQPEETDDGLVERWHRLMLAMGTPSAW
jgi:hypothetical protein